MFISLEGIDGAGKSTQLELLIKFLKARSVKFIVTREPGGCEISEKIRHLLLDKQNEISTKTELLLMIAARSEHYEKIIKPALKDGTLVICDRFIDSTTAYQGFGREIDLQTIDFLNNFATEKTVPDVTLFFDIDAKIATKRLAKKSLDRFENEGLKFQEKIRAGFLEIAKKNPYRFKVIDTTNLTPDEIHKKTLEILREKLHF